MTRPRKLVIPPISQDRNCRIPLQRQIYREIARSIRSGSIEHQASLPGTRTLAEILGVSRNTVVDAYDELAADGLIRAERGSGMRVNGALPRVGPFLWMKDMIRAAQYPERIVPIVDPDGNSLYLTF